MLDRDLGHLGQRAFTPEQQRYHSEFAVLLQGQPRHMNMEGKLYQEIPSLLIDTKSRNFFLGVFLPEENAFYNALWGESPEVIHGWRALKLLESLPVVDNMILHATWGVTRRESLDPYYMDKIAHLFGGLEQLTTLRNGLMQTGPSPELLQEMIARTRERGVRVDGWELKREIDAGIVTTTPLIEEIIKNAEASTAAAREKLDRQEAELKVPLPDEESLGKLLQQLEIGNIIVGLPFGFFGLDWDFTRLEQVDKMLRGHSYYDTSGESLWRSTDVPTFKRKELVPGVAMIAPFGGEIVQLSWIDNSTQVKVTFKDARFFEGHIYLKTLFERPSGEIEETEYTVPEFREKFELLLQ